MSVYFVAVALAAAVVITACGDNAATPTATASKPTATASTSEGTPRATPEHATATPIHATATPLPAATIAPADESGIEGVVTIGPTCPVQRIESPCPDRPYPADIVVLDKAGNRVAGVASGADGRFRVLLPPGTYTLIPQHKGTPPTAVEQTIAVVAGRITAVQIVYDSGIR